MTRLPSVTIQGTVTDESDLATLTINQEPILETLAEGTFVVDAPLVDEGPNSIVLTATDVHDNTGTATITIIRDITAPLLTLTNPANEIYTALSTFTVSGSAEDDYDDMPTVAVDGLELTLTNGAFSTDVTLTGAANTIEIVASDAAGNSGTIIQQVSVDTTPPEITVISPLDGSGTNQPTVEITGTVADDSPIAIFEIDGLAVALDLGGFSETVPLPQDENSFLITATDAAGNSSELTLVVFYRLGPANPADIAPPLDESVATTVCDAISFLYEADERIQTGVLPGAITCRRAALLRGHVFDIQGAPLPEVDITIHRHPELGATMTRADGMFDMAVNGGGSLTVRYEKQGYLPAQRRIEVAWQDYAWLPDVVLVQLDGNVTQVVLPGTEIQVARGSLIVDQDGERQATLLIHPDTVATMKLDDGSEQVLTTLSIRATEYTVGMNGPQAMPAELPCTSGYTYAAELSIDEAIVAQAVTVEFSEPIVLYLENFLGFDVGTIVPAGFYDFRESVWAPAENGLVIGLLGETGGLVDIDIDNDGDSDPDDAAILTAAGITDEERGVLATIYGNDLPLSLWRSPTSHFSTKDCNWTAEPPGDAPSPEDEVDDPKKDPPDEDPCLDKGSLIDCQNQVLGERLAIAGTPFSLNYRTSRVPGRSAAYRVEIPLTDDTVPVELRRVELEIRVAGQQIKKRFPASGVAPPLANLSYDFTWDGRDGYGRLLQGRQGVRINVAYIYDAYYKVAGLDRLYSRREFMARTGITAEQAREESRLQRNWTGVVGMSDAARAQGLGGWSLDIHHSYNPVTQTLDFGNGSQRGNTQAISPVLATVAGRGDGVYGEFTGDNGPANEANLDQPHGVDVGPDGSVYIADTFNHRIRRVSPDGIITTVAGSGPTGSANGDFGGDGELATAPSVRLNGPMDVALGPDGSLYIADYYNDRIRRVDPDGIITTFAGNGAFSASPPYGDEGPATEATLDLPTAVTVGPDGSVYIVDTNHYVVRVVTPDGIINTVAGIPDSAGISPDGGLATESLLMRPWDVEVGPNCTLYIAGGSGRRVRQVDVNGIISTVAGTGTFGFEGDGGPATFARLYGVSGLAVSPKGELFICDGANHRIRMVDSSGIINTIVGNGTWPPFGGPYPADGVMATTAEFYFPQNFTKAMDIGPDGDLYFVDPAASAVRKITSPLPGFSGTDAIVVPSADGLEIYAFNTRGQHLLTRDVYTGRDKFVFAYDARRMLVSITDQYGNVTAIERDADGIATAIVAPAGQRTELSIGADGYLDGLTDPLSREVQLSYGNGHLLTGFLDTRGNQHTYTYDALGRLTGALDQSGRSSSLERTSGFDGLEVTLTSGLGRTTTYQTQKMSTNELVRTSTLPNGTSVEVTSGLDGARITVHPDGTIHTLVKSPDSRFGMVTPVLAQWDIQTPGNLVSTLTTERQVTLLDPLNPMSLATITTVTTYNLGTPQEQVYERVWDAPNKTFTLTTPDGRQVVNITDDYGQVIERRMASFAPFFFDYDGQGRLIQVTQGEGAAARTWTYDRFPDGRPREVTDPLLQKTSFVWDADGRVVQTILPDGGLIDYQYDAVGDLSAVKPPGQPLHAFTYSIDGRVSTYEPPLVGADSVIVSASYTADGKVAQIDYSGGITVDFSYDTSGRLATVTIPRGQYVHAYANGHRESITAPDLGMLSFGYDGFLPNVLTWTGTVNGQVSREFDNRFRPSSQSINGTSTVDFVYDADGFLINSGDLSLTWNADGLLDTTTMTGGVTITETWTYNQFGEPETYDVTSTGNPSQLLSFVWTHDKLSRVITESESVEGQAAETSTYEYDANSRLVTATKNSDQTTYGYDANGNRQSLTDINGTVVSARDERDRLTDYGNRTYSFSASGHLMTKNDGGQTTIYEYDALGNLIAVTLPSGVLVEYIIDSLNRRIGKKVDNVLVQGFLYDAHSQVVAELDGSGAVKSRFVYGSRANVPDYFVDMSSGKEYRILHDLRGSPRLVIDLSDGSIVQRLEYDAFGKIIDDAQWGLHPFGFAGGLYDPLTGLVRYVARDYDPETGRWTAPDPLRFSSKDTNFYAYAQNDPINRIDPFGLEPSDDRSFRDMSLSLIQQYGGNADDAYFQVKCARMGDEIAAQRVADMVNNGCPLTELQLRDMDHHLCAYAANQESWMPFRVIAGGAQAGAVLAYSAGKFIDLEVGDIINRDFNMFGWLMADPGTFHAPGTSQPSLGEVWTGLSGLIDSIAGFGQ